MLITDSNSIREELTETIQLLEENIAHQRKLRKHAIKLAREYMAYRNTNYIGTPNKLYIGPDVDNHSTILLLGTAGNSALTQMETLGKRVSLRRPRVNKGKANKELIKEQRAKEQL